MIEFNINMLSFDDVLPDLVWLSGENAGVIRTGASSKNSDS